MSLSPEDKVQVHQSIVMSLANINILTHTTIKSWNEIVDLYCSGADETVEKLQKRRENQQKVKLFSIVEEPSEFSINQNSINLNNISLNDETDPHILSNFEQKLSIIKCDKNDEHRRHSQIDEFIDKSTLDDICGEALIVSTQMIDTGYNKPSVSKSIQIKSNEVPEFSQESQISEMDDKLNFLRQEYESMRNSKSKHSIQTPVQYILTDYNSNESSNIDDYSYQWRDSGLQNEESVPPQQYHTLKDHQCHSPKKKRLYCNNKKIPHWAEDMKVLKENINQQNLKVPFGEFNEAINHDIIFPGQKGQVRGSSAQWKQNSQQIAKEIAGEQQRIMHIMQEIHDENMQVLKSATKSQQESGMKNKIIGLLKSVKKIWNQ